MSLSLPRWSPELVEVTEKSGPLVTRSDIAQAALGKASACGCHPRAPGNAAPQPHPLLIRCLPPPSSPWLAVCCRLGAVPGHWMCCPSPGTVTSQPNVASPPGVPSSRLTTALSGRPCPVPPGNGAFYDRCPPASPSPGWLAGLWPFCPCLLRDHMLRCASGSAVAGRVSVWGWHLLGERRLPARGH